MRREDWMAMVGLILFAACLAKALYLEIQGWEAALILVPAACLLMNALNNRQHRETAEAARLKQAEIDSLIVRIGNGDEILQAQINELVSQGADDRKTADEMRKVIAAQRISEAVGKRQMR